MTLTPRPYQLAGRDFLASRKRALLADEMRVGKTPQAILAAQKLGAESMLVLCPAIAVPVWEREFDRWWRPKRTDVLSYDRARNLWQSEDSGIGEARWDVMVADEAHFCKNPSAARTKMVYAKGGLGVQAGALWALSGTPMPKHAGELWPMLRAFGATPLSYDAFTRRYCAGYYDRFTRAFRITGTREEHVPELRAMLAPHMLRRTRREVAPELPAIEFNSLPVVPDTQADLHAPDLPDDELLAWVEAHPAGNKSERLAVAEAKIGPLFTEISQAIGEGQLKQTVVFGWHVEPLQILAWRLKQAGIPAAALTGRTSTKARADLQHEFGDAKIAVLCAQIIAAGTAIDLSTASHAYFLELDWVPGNNAQAANRLISLAKQEPVTVDVMTWPGSTDDRVQRVLLRRVREINQLI